MCVYILWCGYHLVLKSCIAENNVKLSLQGLSLKPVHGPIWKEFSIFSSYRNHLQILVHTFLAPYSASSTHPRNKIHSGVLTCGILPLTTELFRLTRLNVFFGWTPYGYCHEEFSYT